MSETQTTPDTDDGPFYTQYEVLIPDVRAKKFRRMDPKLEETKVAVLEDYLTQFDRMVSVIQGRDHDSKPYDTIIFLDKSARPLSWMLTELWDDFAEPTINDEGHEVLPPKPLQKFLNIDRLLWRKDQETENEFHDMSEADIEALRAVFQLKSGNVLDGDKRILIVDEISESGDTQRIAAKLLESSFPDATFDTFAYMVPEVRQTKAGPSYEYPSFPAWYPPKDEKGHHAEDGRGVLDPLIWDAETSLKHPRRFNKFLSSPPKHILEDHDVRRSTTPLLAELETLKNDPEVGEDDERVDRLRLKLGQLATGLITRDPKAEQLRRDIKRLGRDFRAGRLFPVVTAERATIGNRSATDYYTTRRERISVPQPLFQKSK